MIASQLYTKKGSVWKIITKDLGTQKVFVQSVLRLLDDDQESAACRCVGSSLSIFNLNQTWFFELSLVMQQGFLSSTKKTNLWSRWVWRKWDSQSQNQNYIDHVLQWVLATGLDDQSANLQGDPGAYASFSVREATRVMAGQIVAALPWQCSWQFLVEMNIVILFTQPLRSGRIWHKVNF